MKRFIKVSATFDCDGSLVPEHIIWDNSKKYAISKIIDIRYEKPKKSVGSIIRYTCVIMGKEKDLFFDESRWYVETKERA